MLAISEPVEEDFGCMRRAKGENIALALENGIVSDGSRKPHVLGVKHVKNDVET